MRHDDELNCPSTGGGYNEDGTPWCQDCEQTLTKEGPHKKPTATFAGFTAAERAKALLGE